MRVLSLAAAILVLAAPAQAVPAQQGPEAFVRWVYRHYPLPDPMPFEVLGKDAPRLFDGPMVTLIRRDQKLAGDDLPALDFDPICQCQDDAGLRVRSIRVKSAAGDRAVVEVRLYFGDDQPPSVTPLTLDLVRGKAGWRIHDLHSEDTPSLRRFLIQANTAEWRKASR